MNVRKCLSEGGAASKFPRKKRIECLDLRDYRVLAAARRHTEQAHTRGTGTIDRLGVDPIEAMILIAKGDVPCRACQGKGRTRYQAAKGEDKTVSPNGDRDCLAILRRRCFMRCP
jgi:hypothetical protein